MEQVITAVEIAYRYSDGGRAAAGFKGDTGDCVTRSIAIAKAELKRVIDLHIEDRVQYIAAQKGD